MTNGSAVYHFIIITFSQPRQKVALLCLAVDIVYMTEASHLSVLSWLSSASIVALKHSLLSMAIMFTHIWSAAELLDLSTCRLCRIITRKPQNHLFAHWDHADFPWYNNGNCISFPGGPKQLTANLQTKVDSRLQVYSFES